MLPLDQMGSGLAAGDPLCAVCARRKPLLQPSLRETESPHHQMRPRRKKAMSNCTNCQFFPKNTLRPVPTTGNCSLFPVKPEGSCKQFKPLVDARNARAYYGSLSRYARKRFLEK